MNHILSSKLETGSVFKIHPSPSGRKRPIRFKYYLRKMQFGNRVETWCELHPECIFIQFYGTRPHVAFHLSRSGIEREHWIHDNSSNSRMQFFVEQFIMNLDKNSIYLLRTVFTLNGFFKRLLITSNFCGLLSILLCLNAQVDATYISFNFRKRLIKTAQLLRKIEIIKET